MTKRPRYARRRARIEHLVDGFVDFLVEHRHYAAMASTDPAAKRNKLDGEKVTLAQRALTVLFGDNPTGAERLAFGVLFFIPECLPDLADLTDEQLREAAADDHTAHVAAPARVQGVAATMSVSTRVPADPPSSHWAIRT